MHRHSDFEGLHLIIPERFNDARGWFQGECKDFGFVNQMAVAHNEEAGTFRGMHFQTGEFAQRKLIRCIKGSIYDVVLDIRPESKTYLKAYGTLLDYKNQWSLLVPAGFAHGYITLVKNTDVMYLISGQRNESAESGIRWNDYNIKLNLPISPSVISDRDSSWPDFKP